MGLKDISNRAYMAAGSPEERGRADRQTDSINGWLETTSVRLADVTSADIDLTQLKWPEPWSVRPPT